MSVSDTAVPALATLAVLTTSLTEQPPAVRTDTRADASTTLTVRPGPSVCGRLMMFTATVAAAGSVPVRHPSGTVTFRADGGPATPVPLSGGVATFRTPLSAGVHTVTARYTGDACFNAAPLTMLTTWIWRMGF